MLGVASERSGRSSVPAAHRRRFLPPFPVQIVLGVALGCALGFLCPGTAGQLQTIGEVFLNLIKLTIVPLLFPLIVLSIANAGSGKSVGRLAVKSMAYFLTVTSVLLLLGLLVANVTKVGSGIPVTHLAHGDTSTVEQPGKLSFENFILHAVPSNVFEAFSTNNILGVIVFGVLLGFALAAVGESAAPLTRGLEALSKGMFEVVRFIIRLSPIGVAGFVGHAVATYGMPVLLSLGELVALFYASCLLIVLAFFPVIAVLFRVPYFRLLREVGDLVFLAFATRSTEAVLAPLIDRLERFGAARRVVSFTLPLGYSFNADGSAFYSSFAFVFIVNAFNVPMSLLQQVAVAGLLVLLTKGIAGVPSSSIVVLLAAATTVGLPPQGVAILIAVDFALDMARAAVNICGNSLATVVIAKSERAFEVRGVAPARATS